jgi:hypothetical protein
MVLHFNQAVRTTYENGNRISISAMDCKGYIDRTGFFVKNNQRNPKICQQLFGFKKYENILNISCLVLLLKAISENLFAFSYEAGLA